jgi:DNA processing protein
VGELGTDLAPVPIGQQGYLDDFDSVTRSVLDALPSRGVLSADAIARQSGIAAAEVLVSLSRLELAGLIRRRDAGWSIVRSAVIGGAPR